LEQVELGLDEMEALRLADLEELYQDQAAERMRISRATFGRLVEVARRKVADALIHGKVLIIRGGPIMTTTARTFRCSECNTYFQVPHGTGRPADCPACHSANFHRADEPRGQRGRCFRGRAADSGERMTGPVRGRGRCRRRGRMGQVAAATVLPEPQEKEDRQ
jgi:predicted DNA-binding protein (UPF0251 family)